MDNMIQGISKIKKSNIFNEKFYLDNYGDQLDSTADLLDHYLYKGYKEGKNPSPDFETIYYLTRYPDVKDSNLNPLIHYVLYGKKEHRFANLKMELDYIEMGIKAILQQNLFDEDYYFNNYGDMLNGMDCLTHYISFGYKEGKNPSSDFDNDFYLLKYADSQKQNPLIHYALYGRKKGYLNKEKQLNPQTDFDRAIKIIKENNLFDSEYYLNKYVDVAQNGICPVTHYLKSGFNENRKMSPTYNFKKYIHENNLSSDINPLFHFVLHCTNLDKLKKLESPLMDHSLTESFHGNNFHLNNQSECTHIFFASSKIQLKNQYNFISRDLNSIQLSKKSLILSLRELDYNNYENFVKQSTPAEKFSLRECSVRQVELFENNEYILTYLFSKNNHYYKYDISINFNLIEELIFKNISNFSKKSSLYEDDYVDVCFRQLSSNNMEVILNDYITNNNPNNFEVNKEKIRIGNENIYRIISYGLHSYSRRYLFSKSDNCYCYEMSFDKNKLHQEICRVIDSTSPIFDDVKDFLISNYLLSVNDEEFNNNVPNIIDKFNNKISIVIPIYNAYDDTKACIESVFMNTALDFNLFLIDDVSTDERISSLLNQYGEYDNVFVFRNEINKGFTKNVNMGMKLSNSDVILLNSDTIVTKNWDQKLIMAAYSNDNIATVTPMTNASDISVPIMGEDNKIPKFLDINKMGKLLENFSFKGNILAPTGNGFCLFIKRDVLEDVGLFDEKSFDKGYGEETDFTMRVRKNGWINVRNDSVFIFHNRSSSFSSNEANVLRNNHKHILDKRYPELTDDWDKFVKSMDLINSNYLINFALNNYNEGFTRDNILYITNIEDDFPNVDDIESLLSRFNVFILTLEPNVVKLWSLDSKFKLIDKIYYDDEFLNVGQLNIFYMHIFHDLKINLVFLKFSSSFQIPYTPQIIPIKFANSIKIPIIYGKSSADLLNQLDEKKHHSLNKIDFNKEKGVVYTALFGKYEDLLDPKVIHPNLDYICFTDNPTLKSDIWEIKVINNLDTDNTRKARTIKILPHKYLKNYDFSIWIDAGFQIIGDLEEYVNTYSKEGLLLGIKHSWRNSIYEEFDAVLHYQKEEKSIIDSVKERYENEGFPKDVGLIESGLLFRRHNNQRIINLMEEWYLEVMNYSKRDQLSFNYLCWKHDFVYDEVPIFYWKNQFVEHFFHFHNTINNKITYSRFKIVLIANNDIQSTRRLLNSINNINDNLSVVIISLADYSSLEEYNVKNYRIEYPEEFITAINQIAKNSIEDFVYLLCSEDFINYSKVMEIIKLSKKHDINKIGAFILGDFSYIEENIFSNFNDFISNRSILKNNEGVLINKSLLNSNGGFKIESDFIHNFILKLSEAYEVFNID